METLEGLGLKYATERMSERMLKIPTTSARAWLGPDPLATAEGARRVAGAPMTAAELAPPLTYADASAIERPVSEWEWSEAGAGEWNGGEADAEEVGLRRGAANPTYIERAGAERPGAAAREVGVERALGEWQRGFSCGAPTWEGQNLEDCERRINTFGLAAFRAESQHEGQTAGGLLRREWFQIVDDFPHEARLVRFWDMAATEPQPGTDPDWTVGVLMEAWRGQFWSVDVQRLRGSPPKGRRPGRCVSWVGKDYRLKMRRLSGSFDAGIQAGP